MDRTADRPEEGAEWEGRGEVRKGRARDILERPTTVGGGGGYQVCKCVSR